MSLLPVNSNSIIYLHRLIQFLNNTAWYCDVMLAADSFSSLIGILFWWPGTIKESEENKFMSNFSARQINNKNKLTHLFGDKTVIKKMTILQAKF